jgi:hypothetical protein
MFSMRLHGQLSRLILQLLHIRRGDTTTKGAELPETDVGEQDEQNVGSSFGRSENLGKGGWIRILIRAIYLSFKMKIGARQ